MKVAIATSYPADPNSPRGGVEAVSVALVDALSRIEELDVYVLTFDQGISLPLEEDCGRFRVRRLPQPVGSILRLAQGAGRKVLQRELRKLNPDIIHAHDHYGMMIVGANYPSIFTIHGFIHGDIIVSSQSFRLLKSTIWRIFETRGWAAQNAIIAISPYVREYASQFSNARIFDIDNPISRDFFEVDWQPKSGRVFSAAIICRRKNTLGLVRGFAGLVQDFPESKLVLAGDVTEEDYFQSIKSLIREKRIEANVDFIGKVSKAEVQRELSLASVFALVSREENSPMGIEEAMAVGVPVVTSNRCGMPYMVRDAESGFLVDPENASEISGALRLLLSDEGLMRAMSGTSKAIAVNRFHPDCVAERTVRAYRRIVG